MTKTWQTTAAGILSICAGVAGVLFGLITGGFLLHVFFFLHPTIAIGIVAIIGGICAMRREAWGLCLAGAICAILIPVASALGIVATILVVLSKAEFKKGSGNLSVVNQLQS